MDLIDLVAGAGLHYDALGESGSVFHLLGCLSEHGKLGMTCIGAARKKQSRCMRAPKRACWAITNTIRHEQQTVADLADADGGGHRHATGT